MPFNFGPGELILVLILALIIVGPGKLPDVGAAIGKSLREFRRAASDVSDAAGAGTNTTGSSGSNEPGSTATAPAPPDPRSGTAPPTQNGTAPDSPRS
jgi:sec-independent protein translocase protein TatA